MKTSLDSLTNVISISLRELVSEKDTVEESTIYSRLQMLDYGIQNIQMSPRQLLQSRSHVFQPFCFKDLTISNRRRSAYRRIKFPELIPSFIQGQRRVEFKGPEFEGASEYRCVILG